VVAEDIEWVTTSTEEAAAHLGVTIAAATEIEGQIVLGVTEIGRGIAEIGDISNPPQYGFETISNTTKINILLMVRLF
jgi:hypothetical protein